MKRKLIVIVAVILSVVLLALCPGCGKSNVQSGIVSGDNETKNGITSEGNDRIMAQRAYFREHSVENVYSFDVKLRDTKTTRTLKVLSNGLRITEVSISPLSGQRKGSAATVVHFSDIHFNAVNEKDHDNSTIMALSEGRDFNRGNKVNTEATVRSLEFAKLFDRTVITGDIMDYYSFGCMDLLKNVITEKYDVIMTLGNHETAEIMPSINGQGYTPKYSMDEKYDYLNNNIWTNDVYLYSEILLNSEGDEKAILLLLDNSTGFYRFTEKQLDEMEKTLDSARKKQIPVLIFEHCPISTGWGDENGNDLSDPYDIVTNPNGVNVNLGKTTSSPGGSGNNDAMTKKVYDLIVSNGDIIKGIFCGHEHNNIYTEIMATAPDGSNVKIPQYTVSGNYIYSNVIQITVL